MAKSNLIYEDQPEVYAKYYHPQSDEFLEYESIIQIRDRGKQPVSIQLKFSGLPPSFAPMPPEQHIIKAKDIIDLYLKLRRWFGKYGYELM